MSILSTLSTSQFHFPNAILLAEQSLALCALLRTKPGAGKGQFYKEFITIIVETLEWDYFSVTDSPRIEEGYGLPLLRHTNAETHNFTRFLKRPPTARSTHISRKHLNPRLRTTLIESKWKHWDRPHHGPESWPCLTLTVIPSHFPLPTPTERLDRTPPTASLRQPASHPLGSTNFAAQGQGSGCNLREWVRETSLTQRSLSPCASSLRPAPLTEEGRVHEDGLAAATGPGMWLNSSSTLAAANVNTGSENEGPDKTGQGWLGVCRPQRGSPEVMRPHARRSPGSPPVLRPQAQGSGSCGVCSRFSELYWWGILSVKKLCKKKWMTHATPILYWHAVITMEHTH